MKACTKCKIEKPLDGFNSHPSGPMVKNAQLFETMFHIAGYGVFQHKY
tara:strand:- start:4912 stop:5055 length:144 start_codon:yes stop_codon:yes gene_type:complete